MSDSSRPRLVFVASISMIAILFGTMGCAPRQVIFDGIALVRSSGQVVVVQHEPSAEIPDGLNLTPIELELIRVLRAETATSAAAPLCLTLSGSPYCQAIPPCKECIVLTAFAADGKLAEVDSTPNKKMKIRSAPFAYTCKCTTTG